MSKLADKKQLRRRSTDVRPDISYDHFIYTVYQPIVDIKTRKVMGYEALTRLRNSAMKNPEDMFRHSYETGQTLALDYACLNSAIQILPKLKKGTLLFLNVEPLTLAQTFHTGRAGGELFKRMSKYSRRIVFELTEGMKARDFPYIRRGAKFLRKFGSKFAIDDIAGIGHKLYKLHSLKPDFLKIDMSLVIGVADNPINQKLLHQLVELGKKSRCRIIAEGVERKKDLAYVKGLGIHFAQGFYYGRPNRKPISRVPRK